MALFKKEKTYTISQKQLDDMNRLYDAMVEENKRIKAENEELSKVKAKDDLLFNYENENREFRAEIKDLKSKLNKAKKELNQNYTTMSAVLEKLDSTSRTAEHAVAVAGLYRDMEDYHTIPSRLRDDELPFVREKH